MEAIDRKLAREAKAIVCLAFRNGPIENIHAGKRCAICNDPTVAICDHDMKVIVQSAVDKMYRLLFLKKNEPEYYDAHLRYGDGFVRKWDDPKPLGPQNAGRECVKCGAAAVDALLLMKGEHLVAKLPFCAEHMAEEKSRAS